MRLRQNGGATMSKKILYLEDPITVQDLINELQSIEDKNLLVTLSAPNGYTDYFWIEVGNNDVILGTT